MDDKEARSYIAILVVGVAVIIVAVTLLLKQFSKYYQCINSTTVWCSDKWKCETNTDSTQPFNQCFQNATESSGLASCLFGPDSVQASACYDGTCMCPNNLDGTANCYSGCPINLDTVSGSTACCCNEGGECTPC